MSKFWMFFIVAVLNLGCTVHESIKNADTASLSAEVVFVNNLNTLFLRTLTAYKSEAYGRVDLFIENRVLKEEISTEDSVELGKVLKESIDSEEVKVLTKYIEIKKDWETSLQLRKLVSEFLENISASEKIYIGLKKELTKSGKKDN